LQAKKKHSAEKMSTTSVEGDSRWRCCCGLFSVITGTWITLGIDIGIAIATLITCAIRAGQEDLYYPIIAAVCTNIVWWIAIPCTIVGINQQRANLLIVNLFQKVFFMLFCVVAVIGCTIDVAQHSQSSFSETFQSAGAYPGNSATYLALFGIGLVMYIWFFVIVFYAYKYLQSKSSLGGQEAPASYSTFKE